MPFAQQLYKDWHTNTFKQVARLVFPSTSIRPLGISHPTCRYHLERLLCVSNHVVRKFSIILYSYLGYLYL